MKQGRLRVKALGSF